MNTPCRSFLAVLLLSLALTLQSWATVALPGNSVPAWSVTVPTSTLSSDSSSLQAVYPGLGGTTLVIILHSVNQDMGGGIMMPLPMGAQILLLSPAGKILATADTLTTSVTPLLVSSKRCVLVIGSVITEFKVDTLNTTFVQSTVTLENGAETRFSVTPAQDSKFVYTTLSTSSKVSTIKRYLPVKLVP